MPTLLIPAQPLSRRFSSSLAKALSVFSSEIAKAGVGAKEKGDQPSFLNVGEERAKRIVVLHCQGIVFMIVKPRAFH